MDSMDIALLVSRSHLIEAFAILTPIRFYWSRRIPDFLDNSRSSALLIYFLKRRSSVNSVLLYQIESLLNSNSSNLDTVLHDEKELQLKLRTYNMMNSKSHWKIQLFGLLLVGFLLYFIPLFVCSLVAADFILARAHQHVLSSLYFC